VFEQMMERKADADELNTLTHAVEALIHTVEVKADMVVVEELAQGVSQLGTVFASLEALLSQTKVDLETQLDAAVRAHPPPPTPPHSQLRYMLM
jgi:hypothetical protein